MGKSQRTKGAVFEREVCGLFSRALGRMFNRNIGQARDGGNDIDIGRLVVECKRRKSLKTLRDWYLQADAAASGRMRPSYPIVVMREDNGEPMVLLSFEHFITLTSHELIRQIDGPFADNDE